jgi:hypothetical protein
MGHAFGAMGDHGRGGGTSGAESGGTCGRFVAISRFGSERPTPNAQRPTLNSEDD